MENSDALNQLDPSAYQNLLGGGSGASLVPESFITLLTVGFIVLNVVSILFLVAYVFTVIRKWKVQTAILHMQKDVAELKTLLSPQNVQRSAVEPTSVQVEPKLDSREIAAAKSEDASVPPRS